MMTKDELDYWLGEISTSIFVANKENAHDLDYKEELRAFKDIVKLAKVAIDIRDN
jgi:hypothetical protein